MKSVSRAIYVLLVGTGMREGGWQAYMPICHDTCQLKLLRLSLNAHLPLVRARWTLTDISRDMSFKVAVQVVNLALIFQTPSGSFVQIHLDAVCTVSALRCDLLQSRKVETHL